jgi:hypothetical protein
MDKEKLVSLIDGQLSLPSSQPQLDEAAEKSTGEAPEKSTGEAAKNSADGDQAMMYELARSFIEAHRSGPLSPQDAEAYDRLFKYFGGNK